MIIHPDTALRVETFHKYHHWLNSWVINWSVTHPSVPHLTHMSQCFKQYLTLTMEVRLILTTCAQKFRYYWFEKMQNAPVFLFSVWPQRQSHPGFGRSLQHQQPLVAVASNSISEVLCSRCCLHFYTVLQNSMGYLYERVWKVIRHRDESSCAKASAHRTHCFVTMPSSVATN